METITSGLYDGNLNCIREYIQNSIDSKANHIDIFFDNGISDLIIKDDGSGMNKSELENSLGIGTSSKSDENIGWRGIGIWSGVPVSKRIVIITKKKNDKKYRIEINNEIIRQNNLSNKPILDILSISTGDIEELPLGRKESHEEDHFTVIRLESILSTQRYVFNDKEIANYLSREAPVPFDKDNFSFATEIDKWLEEKGVSLPCAIIRFNGLKLYRPPFKSNIYLNKLIKKEFYIKNDLIAVGWFLTGIANEKLREPNCGIYFKKNGFTIGDANLVLRQFSGTYHPWQFGEIHIISKDLHENAARNNFEYNNGNVGLFLKSVGNFIRHLEQLNRYKSQKTSPKQFEKIKENIKNKNYSSIDKDLSLIKERSDRPVSFTSEPSIQVMRDVIDSEFDRYQTELNAIKDQISNKKPNEIKKLEINIDKNAVVKDNMYEFIKMTDKPDNLANSSRSKKPSILLDQVNSELFYNKVILESLIKTRDLLKEQKRFDDNEIIQFVRSANGSEEIFSEAKLPIRCNTKENKKINQNIRFEVMVYAIYDLFANLYKYDILNSSHQWLEDSSKEEKDLLNAEMILIIDSLCRLIEKFKNQKYEVMSMSLPKGSFSAEVLDTFKD